MIESVDMQGARVTSHGIPWDAFVAYQVVYRRTMLDRHRAILAEGGIVVRDGRPAALHACTICGKRTCPSVTTGHCGCVDTDKAPPPAPAWQGDKPTTCQNPGCYGVSLTEVFWDGILPDGNGRTHGLYCDLCALTRGTPGKATKYRRARGARAWRKVAP